MKPQDELIQSACAFALKRARPVDKAAWQALEKGKSSTVKVVREAVEESLKLVDPHRLIFRVW